MIPLLSSDWDNVQYWLKHSSVHVVIILAVLLVAYVIFRSVFPRVAKAAMMSAGRGDAEALGHDHRGHRWVGADRCAAAGRDHGIAGVGRRHYGDRDRPWHRRPGTALGAQAVVKDAVNGIFLLAEDQYRTGDVITIAEVTCAVESISLRRTIIRDEDGVVHSVPNGSIGVLSNRTRDYAQVNVDVRVSYGEDLAKVRGVVGQVAKAMSADAAVGELLMEPPRVKRIDSVGDTGATITISARTRPAARGQIDSELRQRLAEALVRENVHVPFPVYAPEAEKPAG